MSAANKSKQTLRATVRDRITILDLDARRRADEQIVEAIAALDLYENARQLIGYTALGDEVRVDGLLRRACEQGKMVYLPVVEAGGGLRFARWSPGDPMQRSDLGVDEPLSTDAPAEMETISLVPGRAFDRDCNRLGRGGGHYDRAMERLSRLGPTVGVAYSCQVFDKVPVEQGDRRVGLLVTDTALYRADAE